MSPRVKILYGILNSRSIFQGVKIPYDTGTNNRFNYGFLLLCLLVGQENRYIYLLISVCKIYFREIIMCQGKSVKFHIHRIILSFLHFIINCQKQSLVFHHYTFIRNFKHRGLFSVICRCILSMGVILCWIMTSHW
jgi:hypothetical protein